MRKITNLLVCLVLALLASTNVAWGITLHAVDGSGNTVNGLVSVDYEDFEEGIKSYDSFGDITLLAKDNAGYVFAGFYTNAACTQSAGVASEDFDEGYWSLDVEAWDEDDVFYAKFTCPSGNCTGGSSFTPQYYKVRIVNRYHKTGSTNLNYGGGKICAVTTTAPASTAYKIATNSNGQTFGAFETGETNIIDFYLYAQNYNNYVFEGWYTDMSCKNLISTGVSYHYTYTQADLDACDEGGDDFDLAPRRRNANAESGICPPVQFTTKSASSSAVATTIYAKFRDAFVPVYYNVRAQVVSPDGNTGGQVFLCDGDLLDDPEYTDDHYDSEYAYSSSRNGMKVYVDLYAKAKDGYEFVGWYADAECTIPLSWNGNDYTQSEECTYSYKESDEDDFDLPLLFSTSTSSSSAPLNTVYAKFRSTGPQTYYAEVRYLADDNTPKHGAYFVTDKTVSNVPITATPLYSQTISLDSTTTAASVEYGKYPNTLPTYYIVPARGYMKNSWTLTNVVSPTGSLTNYQYNYEFNATSTDAANPTIVTLKHTYKDATLKTMNIVSPEGHGSIRFIARNWVENEAHTGLEWKTIDLGTAVGETAENIDFYNTDSIFITAVPDEGYQFREWVAWRINKDEEYEELDISSTSATNPTYKSKGGGVVGGLKAYYDKLYHHYYAAEAEASNGGTVLVSFTNPVPSEAGTYISGGTDWTLDESTEITVYAQATPKEGYEFVGWKTSPSGAMVSFDANYSTTFAATSQIESSPTTLTLYAYFRQNGEVEAKVFDQMGEVTKQGTFEYCLSNAGNNQTVVLYQDVTLADAKNITTNINIDFNGHTVSGTAASLFTINSGKTVTFMDNSESRAGGISVTTNTTSDFTGIYVKGTLNFYGGEIRCTNTSTTSTNPTRAIRVEGDGSTLNLQGGNILTNVANQQAHGVGVFNTGTALLESGSVSATAAKGTAFGVVTNGSLTVTWSVAISATVTSGNDATGVRVSNTNNYSNKTVTISGGTITATASGSNAYAIHVTNSTSTLTGNMAAIAEAGTATTAYALYEENANSKVTVETGRFRSNNTKDVYKAAGTLTLKGGYYTHNTDLTTYKSSDVEIADLQPGTKFYAEGYRFILTDGENPNYVVATANGKNFGSLEDAISYANNNPDVEMTILLTVPEVTLSAGNYTIPAKTTLLVPYKANQEVQPIVERTHGVAFATPSVFSRLTIESGVHINVYGTIEVGALQSSQGQSNSANGAPTRSFGWIMLNEGSEIIAADGAEIRAWGYITGNGTLDIRRGATVREMFQLLDWKGGTNTSTQLCGSLVHMATGTATNEGDVFPMNQYFIQNIESRTTYRPGSVLNTSTSLFMGGMGIDANNVQLIGVRNHKNGNPDDVAMFLMDDMDDDENTWICKWYDVANDRQVYEVNNSASIGNLTIDLLGIYNFPSANFTLPLTNNMTVHLLSGEMSLEQNTVCLAGMQMEIDKLSTLHIPAGDTLYLYDADQWDYYVFDGYYAQRVKYTPSLDGAPTARPEGGSKTTKPGDAVINLKGTMLVEGAVYTTAGGANIYSTNADAGTVTFSGNAAPSETAKVCQWIGHGTNSSEFKYSDCPSVQLKNADGTFTATSGAAAGTSFCYINGAWRNMTLDGCFAVDNTDSSNPVYFAKPKDYVQVTRQRDTKGSYSDLCVLDNHTYDYVAAWNKQDTLLILTEGCQWWKVVPVEEDDAVFRCTHPDNEKYYYYDNTQQDWVEKKCTVTWNNYDGTELAVYNSDYKSMPEYLGTNPSREMNDYYTYDFNGWTPELAPVIGDVIYTAQFEQKNRRYLITFLDADGTELETALWATGEMPVCTNEPTPQGQVLTWEPTIRAVTGDATYRATYTDQLKSGYTITFVNWNGEELQSGSVTSGTIPEYGGATPTKPSIQDEAFIFAGWTPDLTAVSADAVYTAMFTTAPATYTVTFKRAIDNTGASVSPAVEIESHELGYGQMPVCSNPPVKTPTETEYYTVIWTPQIASVTGDITYTATGFEAHKNTCRLTVTASANGQVRIAEGAWKNDTTNVYEFGTAMQISASAATGYRFVHWSDGNTENPRSVTVNAAVTLKAEFARNQYTISWKDYDNSSLGSTTVSHGEIPSHAAPAREDNAGKRYTFNGWTPAITAANANTTYTATYTEETLTYTIRFVLNNGLSDVIQTKTYGATLSISNPVPASVGNVQGVFAGWKNSAGTVYAADTPLPNVTNNEVYSAQYELHNEEIVLIAGTGDEADAKDIDISEYGINVEASTLIIEEDGSATIPAGTSLQVEDFILESNTDKSGQLTGGSRINVTGNAYFDVRFNGEAGTAHRTWYAIAVPWEVNSETGIWNKEGNRRLVLGRDFDLVWYDGQERAANGDSYACWRYLERESDKLMHPGKMYMMYFAGQIKTVRFEKMAGAPIVYSDDAAAVDEVETYPLGTGNATDANWNGIANPSVCHAFLNAGTSYGQVLGNGNLDDHFANPQNPVYNTVMLNNYKFVVGKPVFVQATESRSVVVTPVISGALSAPRRANAPDLTEGIESIWQVSVGRENQPATDNLFLQIASEKENRYVLGQDLAKGSVAKTCPQMWIDRYDTKLSVNTQALTDNVAEYPLNVYVPETSEYILHSSESEGSNSDYALYLTYKGNAIWNLSVSDYPLALLKGNTTNYGLRICAKSSQLPTGVDEAVVDANGETRKVVIDGNVYIIRNGEVYTLTGKKVQ